MKRRWIWLAGPVIAAQAIALAALNPLPWSAFEVGMAGACSAAAVLGQMLLIGRFDRAARPGPAALPPPAEPDGAARLAFALGVLHEIRQPLFVISLAARNALAQFGPEPAADNAPHAALVRIAAQAQKAAAIAERMLDLVHSRPRPAERVEIAAAIEAAVAEWRLTQAAEDIETRLALAPGAEAGLEAMVDPVGLGQILANALQNAAESVAQRRTTGCPNAGRIDIELARKPGWVVCRISDNGAGLGSTTRERAFEPFYSTKPEKPGGLGLFLSKEIVSRAGGTISLDPLPSGGAQVTICLPAA